MLFFYPLFLFSRYFWILIFAQVWWKGKENLLKHPNSLFFSFYPWQHCSSSAAGLMEHAGPTSSLNKDAFWCFPIAHSVGSPPSLFSPLCSFFRWLPASFAVYLCIGFTSFWCPSCSHQLSWKRYAALGGRLSSGSCSRRIMCLISNLKWLIW